MIVDTLKIYQNTSIVNNLTQNFEYDASPLYIQLFTLLFTQKYNIELYSKEPYSISSININSNSEYIRGIGEFINLTSSNIIILNLDINSKHGNHANLIIYRKDKNRLEHYEPNGNFTGYLGQYINNTIKKLVNGLLLILPEFEFIQSWKLHKCLNMNYCNGLQVYTNGNENKGTCQLWCYLITDIILQYPDISTEVILESINHDKNLKISKVREKMIEIIRGFYFQSMKEISDIFIENGSEILIYPGIHLLNNRELSSEILTFINSRLM